MIPLLWLVAGVLLILVELISGTLVLLMLGVASLVAAGASALGAPLGVDVAVFGLSAALLVLLARPPLLRRLHGSRIDGSANAGTAALLGEPAEVVEPITATDAGTVPHRRRALDGPCAARGRRAGHRRPRDRRRRPRGDRGGHGRPRRTPAPVPPASAGRELMDPITLVLYVVIAIVLILIITAVVKSVTVVRQAEAAVIERLGRYQRTRRPG